MAKDPKQLKQGGRSSRPRSPIIDLTATDITPAAAGPTEPTPAGPSEEPAMPAMRADSEPGFSVPIPEAPAESPASGPETAPPNAFDVSRSENPSEEPAGGEAVEAPAGAASSGEAPERPVLQAGGEATEPHGIDPAVFERPGRAREMGAAASILFGGLAGVVATVAILFLLLSLELLPGMNVSDVHARLEGVEASIRSVIEQRPELRPNDIPSAARVDAVDAIARGNEQALDGLRADVASLADRVAALGAQASGAPELADIRALPGELQQLRTDLEGMRTALAAIPADLGSQLSDLQTKLEAASGAIAGIEPQVSQLVEKQQGLAVMISELQASAAAAADLPAKLSALATRQDETVGQIKPLQDAAAVIEENRRGVATLGDQVAALTKSSQAPDADRAARQLVLLDLLDRALREGRPFGDILPALRAAGVGSPALDGLAAVADAGVPPAGELADRAQAILRRTSPVPTGSETGGFFDRLSSSARSLVTITSDAVPEGSALQPREAYVDRLRADDLSGASTALAELDPAARSSLADVAALAELRNNAERSVLALRSEALAALAARS